MDLKSFVKAALNDVMDAVQETIVDRQKAEKIGYVNPKVVNPDEMEIDTIKFDIAISAGTKTKGGGEAGIEVWSVKIGANGERESEASNVSRVEFTLGVSWPFTEVTDAKKLIRVS
ncbi:trypco2 family protein [Roseibium litorale]|uniref:HK97 gp10 family phage protein n=1 Tax=Roseibium litorale TaxID=2803841 RepID=A0ABR9CJI5_9HYPH|nr:trypco2 family protein [Roseibium litorale]MBD8890986.1 hypothetical protein [Roseibium litorale]